MPEKLGLLSTFTFLESAYCLGGIHKPRGQLRGVGVSQMTILLLKPYFVKVTKKGGGGSIIPKKMTTWFMNDPLHVMDIK